MLIHKLFFADMSFNVPEPMNESITFFNLQNVINNICEDMFYNFTSATEPIAYLMGILQHQHHEI